MTWLQVLGSISNDQFIEHANRWSGDLVTYWTRKICHDQKVVCLCLVCKFREKDKCINFLMFVVNKLNLKNIIWHNWFWEVHPPVWSFLQSQNHYQTPEWDRPLEVKNRCSVDDNQGLHLLHQVCLRLNIELRFIDHGKIWLSGENCSKG